MKQYIILGIFTLSCLVFNSCSSDEQQDVVATEVSAENLVTADYAIDGMVCAMGCAKTIQDELTQMKGVAVCSVDFESGKAHVEYDKTVLSEGDIVGLIESMADGQYQVHEWVEKEKEETEKVEKEEVDESGETEGSITEVKLPSFNIPNLFALLFNQI
ncbi:MAG: heavy-metal-associated domain-containing protein [Flavobacteriales bacterium]|nr:heavy-metal-associated domain-containing protein [Flavobacteriales bacterium]